MTRLTDIDDFALAQQACTSAALWALFDGNREFMNLAHECLDRHRGRGPAISVKFADGTLEHLSFDELADSSSQFAHWLQDSGVAAGERVAVMLEPGRAFYTCMFGAIKAGAIAVPLFTLFGPEGVALRLDDCQATVLVTSGDTRALAAQFPQLRVVAPDEAFWQELAAQPTTFSPDTRADALAVFQYTSGTTRELPEAVKHSQRSVVTVMVAALYGIGLRPGDRYFCPSSPAWGHGLWHGTIAALALGIHIGAYAGKFDPLRVFEALTELHIDNFAAAATVYRMLRNSGLAEQYPIKFAKCSFTGEPLDPDTFDWIARTFGVAPGSMYGTTEVGVIMLDYPGMRGHRVKRGALGKPAPGNEVAILDEAGVPVGPNTIGEIAVKRRAAWFRVKDFGRYDEEGYFYHAGRADDVIISAGWTMSAVEIENTLLTHAAVAEAAVIGVPDALRGQIVKAYVVLRTGHRPSVEDLQTHMQTRLARHEYPRALEFVAELPKTPAGKINRKALRDRAQAALTAGDPSPS